MTTATNSPAADPITRHARKIEANVKASQWLAKGNAARERGDFDLAERHFERASRWLDEYNRLAGNY